MTETDSNTTSGPARTRVLVGRVASNAMDKTAVVRIERRLKHALYGKYIRRSTKLKVHDPDNVCKPGDWVEIAEVGPISRHKSWALRRVLDAAGEFDTAG